MDILCGSRKNYAWGTTDRIPGLLGHNPTGDPFAEYWLGAHPAGPATVGGVGLDVAIAADPGVLGERSRRVFGDRLPFLMKLLSAARALSLQVHPTAEQAREGFVRENGAGIALGDPRRTYKDDWPKPEIMVALEPFEALYGFRDPRRSAAILRAVGGAAADGVAGRLEAEDVDLVAIVRDLLVNGDPAVVAGLAAGAEPATGAVRSGGDARPGDDEVTLARDTVARLGREHPGDPGIVVALLMNRLRLEPLEALYVPAGVMHAYLSGTGVEVMASSDNVVRGGLTPKHIDLDGLTEIVDPHPSVPGPVPVEAAGDGVVRYLTPAPHFALWRLDPSTVRRALPATDSPRIFLTVRGGSVLTRGAEERRLAGGGAVFIAAGESVEVAGDGLGFLTSVAG